MKAWQLAAGIGGGLILAGAAYLALHVWADPFRARKAS